jgi:hypothetical protein
VFFQKSKKNLQPKSPLPKRSGLFFADGSSKINIEAGMIFDLLP